MDAKRSKSTLGSRLKFARKNAGMTQVELASRIGIHSRNYSKYERGDTEPSTEVLARICRVLDVSSDFLIGVSDNYTQSDNRSDFIYLMGSDGSRHLYNIPDDMSLRVDALLRAGVPEIMEDE